MKPFAHLILLVFFIALLFSCKSKNGSGLATVFSSSYVDKDEFAKIAESRFPQADTTDSLYRTKCLSDMHTILSRAYTLNNYHPIWISGKGIKSAAVQLLPQIDSLKNEGIILDVSLSDRVQKIITQLQSKAEFNTDTLFAWDTTLSQAYLTVANNLLEGNDFSSRDTQWFVQNDSTFYGPEYLVQHLENNDAFPGFDTFRSQLPEYKLALQEINFWKGLLKDSSYISIKKNISAKSSDNTVQQLISYECSNINTDNVDSISSSANNIRKFQYAYGLKQTNRLDEETMAQLTTKPEVYIAQLQTNLERLRAMPRELGNEYVFVNIPLMELNYLRNKSVQFNSRVIVGRVNNPTPSISSLMTNIVFNPPWGVPVSILKKEIGPGVARGGSGYLRRKGLRAIDAHGRDVTASVNAGNIRRYAITQPPGARNALGEIKFNMPNKESIYIHDTPNRGLFGNSNRALSHGCVRTDNPKLFAETILGKSSYSINTIDSIINKRKTKTQELDRKIPVFITYLTITPDKDGKRLRYLKDIYGRDSKMKSNKKLATLL